MPTSCINLREQSQYSLHYKHAVHQENSVIHIHTFMCQLYVMYMHLCRFSPHLILRKKKYGICLSDWCLKLYSRIFHLHDDGLHFILFFILFSIDFLLTLFQSKILLYPTAMSICNINTEKIFLKFKCDFPREIILRE